MSDRFVKIQTLDKCFSPITVFHGERSYVVPCGKCDGCRLIKANDWSFRLGSEIAASPFTVWFTLTYDNKYVPKLKFVPYGFGFKLISDHSGNIRFDTVKDVLRSDGIEIVSGSCFDLPKIENSSFDGCTYLSKRDIQLFLKNLRTDIYETFGKTDKFGISTSIRYYIIGEYGPSTYRAHAHGLVFTESEIVKDYLIQEGLYKNWAMCNKALFDEYVRLSGDGVRNYVTEYVTSFSRLPQVYKFKEIRPFRLSSKSPAIGFSSFDKEAVLGSIIDGCIEYDVAIDRIDKKYRFRYPLAYLDRLLPKCREYSSLSDGKRSRIYGLFYKYALQKGFDYYIVSEFLRAKLSPVDFYASKTCLSFVSRYGFSVDFFVWLVDRKEYLKDMYSLRKWYQWQEETAEKDPLKVFRSYSNLGFWLRSTLSEYKQFVFNYFCSGFGLIYTEVLDSDKIDVLLSDSDERERYRMNVEDIVSNMDKSKKVKEMAQTAPTNNPYIY